MRSPKTDAHERPTSCVRFAAVVGLIVLSVCASTGCTTTSAHTNSSGISGVPPGYDPMTERARGR